MSRRISRVFPACLLLLLWLPAAAETQLGRAAFFVADMDRSLSLYRDVLALREVPYTEPIRDPDLSALMGFSGVEAVDIRVLEAANGGRIALMSASGGPHGAPPAISGLADTTLLLSTERLHAVHAGLQAAGARITRPPLDLPADAPNALYAVDPDGIRLIIVQNVARAIREE